MNLGVLAKSGWGKSYTAQSIIEENLPDYDTVVILDEGDEYTGLVEHFEKLKRWGVGEREASADIADWQAFLKKNPWVQLPRHNLGRDDWAAVCNKIVGATRRLEGTVLVVIDEAHLVAPQSGKLPKHIEWLGTTGRKNGYSTIIITQRPAKIDKDVLSQMVGLYLGGFGDPNDRDAFDLDYPPQLHDPVRSNVRGVPEELYPDDVDPSDPCPPLRRWTEGEGDDEVTVGSEWIYSDDDGDMARINTKTDVEMASTHYAPEGESLKLPGVG